MLIPTISTESFLQVATRGLCAIAQAESLRYKLIGGLAVRRACYGVLRSDPEERLGRGVTVLLPGSSWRAEPRAAKWW